MKMEVRSTEGLTEIGTFKYSQCFSADCAVEEGYLYSDENGNMVAGAPVYLNPHDTSFQFVWVIPEEDVCEINFNK